MDESNSQTEAYIERYLSGEMTAQEKQTFEDLLIQDELLREELRLQQKAHQVIFTAGREEMRKEIASVWEEVKAEDTATRILPFMTSRQYIFAGAAVIALLIATIILWQQQQPRLHQKIYQELAENAKIPPGVVDLSLTFRMGESKSDIKTPEFTEAYNHYHEKRYNQAASQFLAMLTEYPESDTVRFMTGISLLKGEAPADAIPYFESLQTKEASASEMKEKVAWNLGLAYLSAGRLEEAVIHLKPFVNAKNKEQANAARNALEQITSLPK